MIGAAEVSLLQIAHTLCLRHVRKFGNVLTTDFKSHPSVFGSLEIPLWQVCHANCKVNAPFSSHKGQSLPCGFYYLPHGDGTLEVQITARQLSPSDIS